MNARLPNLRERIRVKLCPTRFLGDPHTIAYPVGAWHMIYSLLDRREPAHTGSLHLKKTNKSYSIQLSVSKSLILVHLSEFSVKICFLESAIKRLIIIPV